MKIFATALTCTAVFAAGLAGSAVAAAAPASHRNAADLVMQLQDLGNTVIVNRTGGRPLSECTVTAVRPGQTYDRFDSGYPGAQQDPMVQVRTMTVFVDAAC